MTNDNLDSWVEDKYSGPVSVKAVEFNDEEPRTRVFRLGSFARDFENVAKESGN